MLESWFASSLVLVIMNKYLSNIRYTHTLKHIRQANVPHGADDADTAARGDKLGVGGWAAELKLALLAEVWHASTCWRKNRQDWFQQINGENEKAAKDDASRQCTASRNISPCAAPSSGS